MQRLVNQHVSKDQSLFMNHKLHQYSHCDNLVKHKLHAGFDGTSEVASDLVRVQRRN
jgi:hypothetical protein